MFMYSKMSRYGNVILTLTLLTSIYFLCHSLYLHSSNVYLSQRVDVFAAFQKNICLFYVRTISVRAFFIIWIKNLIFLDNSIGNRWLVLFSTFFRFFKFFNLKHMFVTKFVILLFCLINDFLKCNFKIPVVPIFYKSTAAEFSHASQTYNKLIWLRTL